MTYSNILVCLDLRHRDAEALLSRAARLIAPGGNITALTVVELGTFDDARDSVASLLEEEFRSRTAHLERLCKSAGLEDADVRVLSGKAGKEIADFARQHGTELVVMGDHGEQRSRPLLGSTAEAALRWLECDALVVRTG